MMRVIVLLLVVIATAFTAEEALTLTDGRILIGNYDEDAGTIEITAGNAKAKVPVKKEQIAKRESLERKPQERNFILEAQRLSDIDAANRAKEQVALNASQAEIAKQQAKRAQQVAVELELSQRKLDFEARMRELQHEQDEERRKAAVEAALKEAADAERKRKAQAEEEAQLNAQRAVLAVAEREQLERDQATKQRLARERIERDKAELQQRQAAEAAKQTEARNKLLLGILLFFALIAVSIIFWCIPFLIARARRFPKTRDVGLLVGLCFLFMIASAFGGDPTWNIIGRVVAAFGWCAGLLWVLIASAPPKKTTD